MKKRIMKRQLLAVAMAMALLVPQGVYAAEELQLPAEQLEEQQISEFTKKGVLCHWNMKGSVSSG